jgi:predicted dehydrogenase
MAEIKASSKRVNVAVVGLGFMGTTHLRAYLDHPRARVVAVCSDAQLPVNGVLSGVAGNIKQTQDINLGPSVKAYRELKDLLADSEVELVDICTPTAMHEAHAMAALHAEKHVLCEKPLARTSEAARRILAVTEGAPGFLMPAMCMRFWPGWSLLKRVVDERPYGQVLAVRFRRLSAMPGWTSQGTYSAGADCGGALFDLHIHDTDFVNFLFGRPRSVFSTGALGAGGMITHVVTQYQYPGGPSVCAEGSWLLPAGFHMSYTVHCERAMLDYDLARGAEALRISEPGQAERVLPLEPGDGYGAEIGYFVDCVAERRAPSVVIGRDGATALEICEAEERSLRSGAAVAL